MVNHDDAKVEQYADYSAEETRKEIAKLTADLKEQEAKRAAGIQPVAEEDLPGPVKKTPAIVRNPELGLVPQLPDEAPVIVVPPQRVAVAPVVVPAAVPALNRRNNGGGNREFFAPAEREVTALPFAMICRPGSEALPENLPPLENPVDYHALIKCIAAGSAPGFHHAVCGRMTSVVDFVTCTPVPGIKVQLWNTVGHERFRSIGSTYFRGSKIALIFTDALFDDALAKMSDCQLYGINYNADSVEFYPTTLAALQEQMQLIRQRISEIREDRRDNLARELVREATRLVITPHANVNVNNNNNNNAGAAPAAHGLQEHLFILNRAGGNNNNAAAPAVPAPAPQEEDFLTRFGKKLFGGK